MPDQQQKRSRTYDAARTKEAILDAAEEAFAEFGYSAARIDAIAKASGYNKSLIYQYFGDKLALYTEVIKRADQLGDRVTGQVIGEMVADESLTSDAAKFRTFLETSARVMTRFLLEHPRYRKILYWEAAEEWKTWNQLAYKPDDVSQLHEIAQAAKRSGLIRQDFDPALFPIFVMHVTSSSLQAVTRYEGWLGKLDSPELQTRLEEQIAQFLVRGIMEPSLL
ncbi:TetR/AcrR family transcriptional regulator [Cohnella lubricantis]|uniref:TetR/AcrR family transcriptional regulator n=1 Tax=Cohnella lubricantis TaxID=2163172 RepID=A0A841TAN4_9BACL|nr:TetR/AcrR family transcriptional regulator [Cohnella lubricantis]MBB6676087.1 TetR/AcrR family transcriptional regulator [Cohnella lubricantis]MBP2118044.1 AcrR family transcriptional regulator [Cohnella lubricantis]